MSVTTPATLNHPRPKIYFVLSSAGFNGRYWIRTSDLHRVEVLLYH